LLDILQERLAECGARADDVIVMAAAGSSDPRARADVERVAGWLSAARGVPVTPAYLAAALPTVPDAVEQARRAYPGNGVTIATYLLAPGLFSARLDAAGADRVAAPLAPHPALAALVLRRYEAAVAAVPVPT
jgi:sirohydrochlorin ferrochelatase